MCRWKLSDNEDETRTQVTVDAGLNHQEVSAELTRPACDLWMKNEARQVECTSGRGHFEDLQGCADRLWRQSHFAMSLVKILNLERHLVGME